MVVSRAMWTVLYIGLIVVSCAAPSYAYTYKGDGIFKDHGSSAASRRYQLTLDSVLINKKYENIFSIGRLPESFMVLSFMYKLDDDLIKRRDEIFDIISQIKIKLKIFIKETGEVLFFYEGNLQARGTKSGKYFMLGLSQGGFSDGQGNSYLEWNVGDYHFDEKISVLGFETSFPKKVERIIEFKIIEPLTPPIKDSGDFFEVVIHGGGWK